jgi:hypothetical protein
MPGLKSYLFFLPAAFFFFATDGALLSIEVSQGAYLAPRLRIFDTRGLFPSGKPRKFQKT